MVTARTQTPDEDFDHTLTEDDLPCSEFDPMETFRHVLQRALLVVPLRLYFRGRSDVFIGDDMFVYYSPRQVLNEDFRGPDLFAVVDVPHPRQGRKSWVTWQEGKAPDFVVELLSDSTRHEDITTKKRIYQDRLAVPLYVWYDPYSGLLDGWRLRDGVYVPQPPTAEGHLPVTLLGLVLRRWEGDYGGEGDEWLRWALPDGTLLPTEVDLADTVAATTTQLALNEAQRTHTAERLAISEADLVRERERNAELLARLARYEQRDDSGTSD